ncbi:MAG: complex I subunit 5 family protein [Candidatus Acidiferrales bacterium]
MPLAPLPVVVPLMAAAVLAIFGRLLHRRVLDSIALATSASVVVITIFLAIKSANGLIVYWFGDWQPLPHSHFPIGICLAIDPIGAGLASLAGLLVLAAFTFSWSYFKSLGALYHVLMLVFLAAMAGLSLTGDLFNMFVWLEVMTAAGVALCGYKSEQSQSLQGALNFAVINTIGAFLSLAGVALLYGATGSLNLAEVGRILAGSHFSERFVTVALLLVIAGFLVKSATFPFHFWLADAHAVAPTPVCILFSGVMVELGLYAIARIYWIVFAQSSQPAPETIRDVFLLMGSLTAVVGALYCFSQRHLKRMLAFSTISHIGLMLIGFALLSPRALGGLALYVMGHGLIKAALFIGAGVLLHRFGSVDEYDLRKNRVQLLPIGALMALGAWGLAGLPPFATFFGQIRIDEVSGQQHLTWLPVITIVAEALTAAAVLRFTARVFFGLGRGRSIITRGAAHLHTEVETAGQHSSVPAFMWAPMALLIIGAAVIAIPLRGLVERYAVQFEAASRYDAAVLQVSGPAIVPWPYEQSLRRSVGLSWWIPLAIALVMIGAAWASLFLKSPKSVFTKSIAAAFSKALFVLRKFQSGRVDDYVAWFAFGIAAYGGMLLLIR